MQIQSILTRPWPLPNSSHFINNHTLWRIVVFVKEIIMKWTTQTSVQWLGFVTGVELCSAIRGGTSEGMGILYIILSVENHEVINICGIIWGDQFLSGVLFVELWNVPTSQEFSCFFKATPPPPPTHTHTHIYIYICVCGGGGACGGAIGWGTALQARRSWVWFPMVSL